MTKQEAIIVSAYTGVLLCDFGDLHAYIEKIMQRPVFTHELGSEDMELKIKEAATPDLERILEDNFPQGLNTLAAEVHKNAVDHGWWEQECQFGTIIALCHSELSEALEEYRAGNPALWYKEEETLSFCADGVEVEKYVKRKPEGVAVELGDCIIRILDYCGKAGIDIEEALRIKHKYNKNRPYRHGGKQC